MATLPVDDPISQYFADAQAQDERWSFDKLVALFFVSLGVPVLIIYLAAKIISG